MQFIGCMQTEQERSQRTFEINRHVLSSGKEREFKSACIVKRVTVLLCLCCSRVRNRKIGKCGEGNQTRCSIWGQKRNEETEIRQKDHAMVVTETIQGKDKEKNKHSFKGTKKFDFSSVGLMLAAPCN